MRVILTALGLLAFALVGGATIWWLFVASFGDRQVDDFIARAAQDGTAISYAERERSGFPFRIRWRLRGVTAEHRWPEGTVTGSIPALLIESKAWRPQALAFQTEEISRWRWRDASGGGNERNYRVQKIDGGIAPREDQPGWRLTAQVQQIDWDNVSEPQAKGSVRNVAAEIMLPFDRRSADFDIRIDDLELSTPTVFGDAVEQASLTGRLSPLPQALTPQGLVAWRDAGGELTLKRSDIVFGALQGSAEGTLALDDQMRPVGNLALHMLDPEAILTIASREGWVKRDQLGYAQIGLGLFSRANAQGRHEMNTKLDMRNGGIWLGPLRLGKLQPVVPVQ